jgi:hypothetical protein
MPGVQTQLSAMALSVKPGGRIGQATVGGRIATRGDHLVTMELDGEVGSLTVGGVHAQGRGSDGIHLRGDGVDLSDVEVTAAGGTQQPVVQPVAQRLPHVPGMVSNPRELLDHGGDAGKGPVVAVEAVLGHPAAAPGRWRQAGRQPACGRLRKAGAPCEVPGVVVIPTIDGSPDCLGWIPNSPKSPPEPGRRAALVAGASLFRR